jgi:hypothetical protein
MGNFNNELNCSIGKVTSYTMGFCYRIGGICCIIHASINAKRAEGKFPSARFADE